MILHPDRWNPTSTLVKLGVVVHTSEGGEASHEQLVAFLARPGDRPTSDGGRYGAGYHAVPTTAGGYVMVADATAGPFHAPPLNGTWWAVCIPGRAGQTREQWLDAASRGYVRGVAQFIFDRWEQDGRSWPHDLVLDAARLKAGARGITAHDTVSRAWGRTNHWDPGPSFPWDVLLADLAALVEPDEPVITPTTEEDGVHPTAIITVSGGSLPPGAYVLYAEYGHCRTWLPTHAAEGALQLRATKAGRAPIPAESVDLNTPEGRARMQSMPLHGGARSLNGVNVDDWGIPL